MTMGERKAKRAKRQKRTRTKSALLAHKHMKSLCVLLVSSCRVTQKECPEACRHAHRETRGTAVIFETIRGNSAPCQRYCAGKPGKL